MDVDLNHHVYKLIGPRPTFPRDMTVEEASVMGEHAVYWQRLVDEGTAVAFGPVFAPAETWGLAIVDTGDEAAVRALGEADPAVSSGVATFEVYPMPNAAVRPHLERR